jgi:hypothetical protein
MIMAFGSSHFLVSLISFGLSLIFVRILPIYLAHCCCQFPNANVIETHQVHLVHTCRQRPDAATTLHVSLLAARLKN